MEQHAFAEQEACNNVAAVAEVEDEADDPAEHVPLHDDEYVENGSESGGASPASGAVERTSGDHVLNEVRRRLWGVIAGGVTLVGTPELCGYCWQDCHR